jgi:hypothetical protein
MSDLRGLLVVNIAPALIALPVHGIKVADSNLLDGVPV